MILKWVGTKTVAKVLQQAYWETTSQFKYVNEACIQIKIFQESNEKYAQHKVSLQSVDSIFAYLPDTGVKDGPGKNKTFEDFFIYFHSDESDLEVDGEGDYTNLHIRKRFSFDLEIHESLRLKLPYKSNCSDNPGGQYNYFPRRYTLQRCHFSCKLLHIYKTCGAVGDQWMQYIPKSEKRKYNNNKTDDEKRKCLSDYTKLHNNQGRCQHCPKPCHEKSHKLLNVGVFDDYESNNQYHLVFTVSYQDLMVNMIEKPLYDIVDVVSGFGGILGLLTGCSALSVIEIFAVIYLSIGAFLKRR